MRRITSLLVMWGLGSSLYGTRAEVHDTIPCLYDQKNIGIDFNYARYVQPDWPDIGGYLAGVHADLYRKRPWGVLLGAYFDGRWNAGQLCSEHDPCKPQDIRVSVADYIVSARLGYNLLPWHCVPMMVTPFVGAGFYRLNFNLKPDIIRRRYCNAYIPVGLEFQWFPTHCFNMGLNVTYRANVHTRLRLTTPELEVCDSVKISNVRGFNIALPMTWYGWQWECAWLQSKIVPFFDWNRFGLPKSEKDCEPLAVPELKRWYLGLSAQVGIRF